MKTIRVLIKRDSLKEKIFTIEDELDSYFVKFLLKDELRKINNKLISMREKGLINSISIPGKSISKELVISRRSIINGLNQFRKILIL